MNDPNGCDECGREMIKATRVYREHRYCSTCYARVFKHTECPRCGKVARIAKNIEKAVCLKCEKDKPCIRCGKKAYRIGKVTKYGPVCNACSVYFRKEKVCGLCGVLSRRTSRCTRLGFDFPICQKCWTQDYATCPTCRRYRLLKPSLKDGVLRCKLCNDKGEVVCPDCKKSMWAGCGKRCLDCSWTISFQKKLKINLALFRTPGMRSEFKCFGDWLLTEIGPVPACYKLNNYIWFFIEVEKKWGSFPDYLPLVTHFSAERLRRVRLPMRWLGAHHGIIADAEIREEDSELRRIENMVQSFPGGSYAQSALKGYRNVLLEKKARGKTTIRSIRLALRPVATLFQEMDEYGNTPLDQEGLDRYLLGRPGQKAAVTGFVNYFNKMTLASLIPRVDPVEVKQIRRKKLESELIALAQTNDGSIEFQTKWITLALEYFHGMPISVAKTLGKLEAIEIDDGLEITAGHNKLWLPSSWL